VREVVACELHVSCGRCELRAANTSYRNRNKQQAASEGHGRGWTGSERRLTSRARVRHRPADGLLGARGLSSTARRAVSPLRRGERREGRGGGCWNHGHGQPKTRSSSCYIRDCLVDSQSIRGRNATCDGRKEHNVANFYCPGRHAPSCAMRKRPLAVKPKPTGSSHGAAASALDRHPPVRRRRGRCRGASPGAGRGHRPPNTKPSGPGPGARGQVGPPGAHSAHPRSQLPPGPRGRAVANISASGPSDRAAGHPEATVQDPHPTCRSTRTPPSFRVPLGAIHYPTPVALYHCW
jgi:hypothetical protein